jgi:hypothetical protein
MQGNYFANFGNYFANFGKSGEATSLHLYKTVDWLLGCFWYWASSPAAKAAQQRIPPRTALVAPFVE